MKIVLQISFSILKVQLYWIEDYCISITRLGLRMKIVNNLFMYFHFLEIVNNDFIEINQTGKEE
jgi:hypothetical protein